MGFLGGIGKIFKKVVGFANKILQGPLGQIASFIPGIGPFVKGAQMVVGAADGLLNGKGFSGVLSGLMSGLGGGAGFLGKAGSLLSKVGLGSVGGLLGKVVGGNSGTVLDMVSQLMAPRQGNTSPAAQGDKYNLSQLAASTLAQMLA